MYSLVACGIEDVIHFVRVGFFLPIYIIRLLYVVIPQKIITQSRRVITLKKAFCLTIWAIGISIGGLRFYARLMIFEKGNDDDDKSSERWGKVSFSMIAVIMVFGVVGMTVSLVSVLCMAKILYKHRPDRNTASDMIVEGRKEIYNSIKSGLLLLLALYITDSVFNVYLTLLSLVAMKIYFTPGCYPEVFIQIRNYLGTTTNFFYSYHCLGVLHGICICIIFFSQNTMRKTVMFIWRVASLVVRYWRRKRAQRRQSASF